MPKPCQTRNSLIISDGIKRTVHFRTLLVSGNGQLYTKCNRLDSPQPQSEYRIFEEYAVFGDVNQFAVTESGLDA